MKNQMYLLLNLFKEKRIHLSYLDNGREWGSLSKNSYISNINAL